MRNLITVAIALLLVYAPSAKGQNFTVSYGPSFEEPTNGWNKVFQLSNGNTFLFHYADKEGIQVTVYNSERKIISRRKLTSQIWEPEKVKTSSIVGLYEINGEPVIFLHQLIDRTPTLFRLRLNAQTGAMTNQKKLGTIARYGAGASWALLYGGVEKNDFFVQKDPQSDCYAVVYFNGFSHESGERIEVEHYNGNHTLLNKAYYDSPDGAYKYLRFIGMTVADSSQLHICTYGYNKGGGGEDSKVIISRLRIGETAFEHKELEFTDDFFDTRAIMQYNPGTQKIQLLTISLIKSKKNTKYYNTLLTIIDPQTMFVTSSKPVTNAIAAGYIKQKLEISEDFVGMPQNMVINPDYTTTIISEEMTQNIATSSRSSSSTTLGNMAVTDLSKNGEETAGYAISKKQVADGLLNPLYQYERSTGLWTFRPHRGFASFDNVSFTSFDYVSTSQNRYILYNDLPANLNSPANKKSGVYFISGTNTVCYSMQDGIMKANYVFGEPGEDNANYSFIESSHYQPVTQTYATLVVKRKGKDKKACVAWVHFNN